jgi:hypothetical protein
LLRALKSYAAASSAKCAAVVPALVALLVESGADPGRADAAGEAPLHHAVLHVRHAARCDDCLRCLLHAGANPGAPPPLVARQSSAGARGGCHACVRAPPGSAWFTSIRGHGVSDERR